MNSTIHPNFILQQMMKIPGIANNQLAQNAIRMYQQGNTQGLNEMVNNLCNEKGITKDDVMSQLKGMFNI